METMAIRSEASVAPAPRAVPRRKTFELVALWIDQASCRAHMLNISAGGACLHSQTAVRLWQGVAIEIHGSRIEGSVSWVAGNRFGVRFTRPLTSTEIDAIAG